jgi:hypothetical protein
MLLKRFLGLLKRKDVMIVDLHETKVEKNLKDGPMLVLGSHKKSKFRISCGLHARIACCI